jgi:hypothetical protein
MASLIGSAIVGVLGLIFVVWLPLRIRAVWRGEKSAPPIPIKKKSTHIVNFEVTDRNFPMFGTAMLCMGVFALFLGLSGVLKSMGVSGVTQLFPQIAAAMLVPAFLCGFVAQAIFSLDRPKFLIPPSLREETN